MVKRLLDFLNASPVNFLAAKNIASKLEQAGYHRLDPQKPIGEVQAGDKLYVTKNDSSVYAFHIGQNPLTAQFLGDDADAVAVVAVGCGLHDVLQRL